MLNLRRFIYLDKPIGGCYLVSKTLIIQAGDFLFGASANNPNSPNSGVVIRLAPRSNTRLIRTFTSDDPPGGGNEFMAIENIVFDGNGQNQTQELNGQALVDWRGTFIQSFLRHVMITNAFGPGLFTGSTELDNIWIIGCSTSTYSWIHNPGSHGLGQLLVNQVFVEESIRPSGGTYQSPWNGSVWDPSQYAHAIWFNGLGSATINQLHCESAATCLDFNNVQTLTIHGISGTRIGNPYSQDPTDQYLLRALNVDIYNITFTAAYFDQEGSKLGILPNSRVFGLGYGVQSHDIYETPVGRTTWPLFTWGRADQSYTGTPFLGERSVVANDFFLQKLGGYSPNRFAFFADENGKKAPESSYAYIERNGMNLNLGFSPGPLNVQEETLLRLNYFGPGDPGNGVQMDQGKLQTGTAENRDLAGEIAISGSNSASYLFGHLYRSHPECQVTPQFDPGPGNRLWVTYSGASMTVNFSAPVTGAISFSCLGRD